MKVSIDACPLLSFSLAVKQDVFLWNWLVLFIWGFPLIAGSLGLFNDEYNMTLIMPRPRNNWLCVMMAVKIFQRQFYCCFVFLIIQTFACSLRLYHLLPHGGSIGQKILCMLSSFSQCWLSGNRYFFQSSRHNMTKSFLEERKNIIPVAQVNSTTCRWFIWRG